MATTKYSHAFLVGSFNGELKLEYIDESVWEREIILPSPTKEQKRYEKDRGYLGLCTMYYKAHLDAMLEAQGSNRPEFLDSVHHYICSIKNEKENVITLPIKKGKNLEVSFSYSFRICRLHLYFFPCNIVLFSIEIDDTGTELDNLTAAHNYLMSFWDTDSFDNTKLSKLMMPLTSYLITNKVHRLTKDGNKLKLFQTVEVDDILLTDDLLYELGTSLPIGCVKKGIRPDMKPSEDYYNKLLKENKVSTFDNWKGLALVDSFTILGKTESFNRDDCNFLYFPLIYLRCIFEKTFCFSRNIAYREDKSDENLAYEIEQMEKYYFYDNISYNFQPSLIYKKMAFGLSIKEEREELAKHIKERAEKEIQNLKEKEENRFNHILSWATIFAVFSIAWDLCSMVKDAFIECENYKTTNARIFLFVGVLVVIVLIYKIFKGRFMIIIRRFKDVINSLLIRMKLKQNDFPFINVLDENRSHLATHFQQGQPGSKFYSESPKGLLEEAMRLFPETFRKAKPDDDGRIRISLTFPREIGVSNVVSIDVLTDEEKEQIEIIDRNGKMVRSVKTDRVIPTNECQIILSSDWHLITMFPGEMAPPLPNSPDIHDEYWDNHVFIITTK